MPVAAGDHLAVAAGLALGGLVAPRAQVRVEIRGHRRIERAQLEQRVARAVAQAHRGERRDQVALRLGAQRRRPCARPGAGARPRGTRRAARGCGRARAGAARARAAAARSSARSSSRPASRSRPGGLEQARRVELVVRARVELDRAVDVAELLGERRGLGVAAHPDEHVERGARALLGRGQRGEQLARSRGVVVELERVAQRARQVAAGPRRLERAAEVPQLLVQVGGPRVLAALARGLRGLGVATRRDQLVDACDRSGRPSELLATRRSDGTRRDPCTSAALTAPCSSSAPSRSTTSTARSACTRICSAARRRSSRAPRRTSRSNVSVVAVIGDDFPQQLHRRARPRSASTSRASSARRARRSTGSASTRPTSRPARRSTPGSACSPTSSPSSATRTGTRSSCCSATSIRRSSSTCSSRSARPRSSRPTR